MRYFIKHRDQVIVKSHAFLTNAKTIGENISKNISKN